MGRRGEQYGSIPYCMYIVFEYFAVTRHFLESGVYNPSYQKSSYFCSVANDGILGTFIQQTSATL